MEQLHSCNRRPAGAATSPYSYIKVGSKVGSYEHKMPKITAQKTLALAGAKSHEG
jgi:hypothetical protein